MPSIAPRGPWERPLRAFFGAFNRGFDALASGYGWLAARVVRFAAIMLVLYAGILAFGLNEFRQTPIGFIPAVDRAFLIIVTQLPPGAALARTDEVNRRAVEIALKTPGISSAVNIVGFSGATFTVAPNAGAIFVVLDSFEKRGRDPKLSANGITRELYGKLSGIQDALIFVVSPPPVQGIGNAGGFRMMIEDRAGRGPQALQARSLRDDGRGGKGPAARPGVLLLRDLNAADLSRHRPHQGADAGRARAGRVRRAADLYRLLLRQRLQPVRPYLPRHRAGGQRVPPRSQGRAEHPRTQRPGPDRAARLVHDGARHLGPVPGAPLQSLSGRRARWRGRPGYSLGQAIEAMERVAARALPDGFAYEWTTLAFQQVKAGNTAIFVFALAVVFVFLVLAAQYESLTLPLAVILIVPMCLVASIVGVVLRGQDNNILTQVGFVVLIGLAAKNAILIVEFAKQLEDRGLDRWQAAVEAARLRLRPILMTSLAFIFGVLPLVWAVGAGAELRQTLGTAVFSGMIGVTIFGLIFTPAFYVVCRWIAVRASGRRPPPAEEPQPRPAE